MGSGELTPDKPIKKGERWNKTSGLEDDGGTVDEAGTSNPSGMRGCQFVGIDGGGTKTSAALADERGRVLKTARAGPTNYVQYGESVVVDTIRALLSQLKVDGPIASLCAGLAGLDRPDDKQFMNDVLLRAGFAQKAEAVSDGLIALYGATFGEAGVILMGGTGVIAWGTDGKLFKRADGWGYLLGDTGSGYDLSRRALVAAFKAYDGRGESTSLLGAILGYFKVQKPEELIRVVYGKPVSVIAGLAPLVFQEAKRGDRVAMSIVEYAADELVNTVNAVLKGLSLDVEGIYVSGGLFQDDLLRELVERKLGKKLLKPPLSPALGAVVRAYINYGIRPTGEMLENLMSYDGPIRCESGRRVVDS